MSDLPAPSTPLDFSLLAENDADPIIVFDSSLCYLYLNPAAERMLERDRRDLIGRQVLELFPDAKTSSPFYEPMLGALRENVPITKEAQAWLVPRWFEIRICPFAHAINPDRADGIVLYYRDITERAERERRERFLASLAERARTLSDDPDAVIADAVRSLGEFLGASRCSYVEVDVEASTATAFPDYCADGVRTMAGVYPLGIYDAAILAEYKAGRVLVQEDVRNDPVHVPPEHLPNYEALSIRSRLVAPLVRSDRLVSTIGVHCDQPRQWTPEEAELVRNVVERTWLTVEIARQHRARQQNEERLRLAVEGADIGTWHWDILRDTVVWSDRGKRIFGFSPEVDMTFQMAESRIHPDERDRVMQAVSRAIQDNTDFVEEYRIVRDDGAARGILARGHAFYNPKGEPVRFEGIVLDITERKHQEEEIKRLNQSLLQMMREVHHRVKNNLQTVAALLDLQSQDDTAADSFSERLKSHVMALATVHDLLTRQTDEKSASDRVPLTPVVHPLLSLLGRVQNARIRHEIADISVPARVATALATILNELISNAIKHGKGEIEVTLSVVGSEGILTVADDGPGFPEGFNVQQQANTGLELVVMLTENNLAGAISFANHLQGGAQVTIRFPIT